MLKLSAPQPEERVVNLPGGASLTFRKVDRLDMRYATTRAVFAMLDIKDADNKKVEAPPMIDENGEVRALTALEAFMWETTVARELARRCLVSWDGIGDDEGNPIEPDPDRIDTLLMRSDIYDKIVKEFVMPLLPVISEKNASSPSPNGTISGAAGEDIANGASTTTDGNAQSAPITSTDQKPPMLN